MTHAAISTLAGLALLVVGSAAAEEIDPRTQCEKVMKGETAADRSWQSIYGPCCKDATAMASKEAMQKCIGERGLEELRKTGAIE